MRAGLLDSGGVRARAPEEGFPRASDVEGVDMLPRLVAVVATYEAPP